MTNKLVFIINSLKVPEINKILLHEMKFFVPNYSCFQNPWLGGYRPQIPVLSVLNWICWTPPPNKIPGYATVQTDPSIHPASYSMGTRGSFHGVKRPRLEAEQWPPVSAEVVAKIIGQFAEQQGQLAFCNEDVMCLLWRRNTTFQYPQLLPSLFHAQIRWKFCEGFHVTCGW